MLVTEIQGNIHHSPMPQDMHIETITISNAQLLKRIQRVRTDHDREVGIRLPVDAPNLQDGDVLHVAGGNAIVVRLEPTDVIVIKARSILEMAVAAHALGNRHLQAQFFDTDSEYQAEVMVVQYDHTVIQYLGSAGIPYERQQRVMPTPFRHSEHTH